jgi:hypothetical protein
MRRSDLKRMQYSPTFINSLQIFLEMIVVVGVHVIDALLFIKNTSVRDQSKMFQSKSPHQGQIDFVNQIEPARSLLSLQ